MPAVISKVGQILTAPENASVVGAVPAATDLIGNAAWTTAAAALMPDVLPAAGTLLSAGGARQLQAGSTVTHAGHFLFSPDNTYDIGANAATRPRTIYVGTSVLAPLFNNPAAAATTLGNSTYGVTVPGAATFSGDISMQKATQGYIRAYGTGGVNNIAMYDDNTNGILSTSSGNLNLVPGGGTVAVTGAGTYTSTVTATGHRITSGAYGWSWKASGSTNYAAIYDETNAREAIKIAPTGTVTLLNNLVINGGTYGSAEAGIIFQQSGAGKWQVYDVSSSLRIYNFATAANAMTIAAATSDATFAGGITASGVVSHGAYTVATLPAAGSNAGKMAQVTDSNVAASGNYGATVAAGGANRVKVFSDGTNWVIA